MSCCNSAMSSSCFVRKAAIAALAFFVAFRTLTNLSVSARALSFSRSSLFLRLMSPMLFVWNSSAESINWQCSSCNADASARALAWASASAVLPRTASTLSAEDAEASSSATVAACSSFSCRTAAACASRSESVSSELSNVLAPTASAWAASSTARCCLSSLAAASRPDSKRASASARNDSASSQRKRSAASASTRADKIVPISDARDAAILHVQSALRRPRPYAVTIMPRSRSDRSIKRWRRAASSCDAAAPSNSSSRWATAPSTISFRASSDAARAAACCSNVLTFSCCSSRSALSCSCRAVSASPRAARASSSRCWAAMARCSATSSDRSVSTASTCDCRSSSSLAPTADAHSVAATVNARATSLSCSRLNVLSNALKASAWEPAAASNSRTWSSWSEVACDSTSAFTVASTDAWCVLSLSMALSWSHRADSAAFAAFFSMTAHASPCRCSAPASCRVNSSSSAALLASNSCAAVVTMPCRSSPARAANRSNSSCDDFRHASIAISCSSPHRACASSNACAWHASIASRSATHCCLTSSARPSSSWRNAVASEAADSASWRRRTEVSSACVADAATRANSDCTERKAKL